MTPVTLVLALAALACGASSPAPVERARYLMGTLCTVSVAHEDGARAAAAAEATMAEVARLEQVLSAWRPDSELSRLPRSPAGTWVPCSVDLAAALDSAIAFARHTGGAFDPTVGPLVEAWDLRGAGRVPDRRTLQAARERVGWQALEIDARAPAARCARPGMALDLGGIGKGFALDRVARVLEDHGVRDALVNLGGEVLVRGIPRAIAIAHPLFRLEPAVELTVGDRAVSTSGQSERGFTARGIRYGHVLDPRTGSPVATSASVTVVCRSAARADAFATACLVMGRARAAAFASAHPEIGVLWLEPDGPALRAWRWNLPGSRAAPGVPVQWMTDDELSTLTR